MEGIIRRLGELMGLRGVWEAKSGSVSDGSRSRRRSKVGGSSGLRSSCWCSSGSRLEALERKWIGVGWGG